MKQILSLLIVLTVGFGGIYIVGRQLENHKPQLHEKYADEDLFFSSKQLNLLGSDFRGLIADWYWINSLQYMGSKLLKVEGEVNINDLRPLNPRLLYPMLDTASTLDPQFFTIYSYGAAVLPAIDNEQAIKLLEKGILANPENWRLYHNLGYIYWRTENYSKASQVYLEGSKKPDAPLWMRQMSANMQAEGGSREFAKEIYRQMFETAEDEQTRTFAELRYAQIQSIEERDKIRQELQGFFQKNNRCPQWREILRYLEKTVPHWRDSLPLNQNGELLDPTGIPYVLENRNGLCDVKLSKDSKIPPV